MYEGIGLPYHLGTEGKTVTATARALDLAESPLRLWVRDAERDARRTGTLSNAARKELEQLRRENRTLRMERDILKKGRPSSPRTTPEGAAFGAQSPLEPEHKGGETSGTKAIWMNQQ